MIVWSYGGGTQSIALAILIAQGKLPTPDMIVFADTGREASETFEYKERYVSPLLATLGLSIEVAGHDLATVDLYSKKSQSLLLPVFTKDGGKLQTFCSSEWKMLVVRRYMRSKGINQCINWLGMSTDEVERLKPSDVKWIETVWPLCGMPRKYDYGVQMSRADCRQCILHYGWPDPPKSSCWMCPHRRNDQWQHLKIQYPQDFAKAVELDEEVRARDTMGGVWLHGSRKPLSEIDFTKDESQPELFGCETGFCWT